MGGGVDQTFEHEWRALEAALDVALELPEADRAARLEAELREQPRLLSAAKAALEGDDRVQVGASAPRLLQALSEALNENDVSRLAGRRIGAYRIVKPLGRGGMGVVFQAERADGQFERRVAIKVLPWSMRSEPLIQGFAAERRLLATLQHPNIAAMLDGGLADDGTPYLVLEYVSGEPIDAYCEQQCLDLKARVGLLIDVCRAVQYAHTRLIVHRDIKPANILVTDDGTVKLLDFGVAKLLDAGDNRATATGLKFLTPEYAAPEQLKDEPVTAATDVYALGVLMFKLLTGHTPFALQGASLSEIVERVCREPAPRLSEAAARHRVQHARRLRGDLSSIAAKTLEKDPGRRYSGAADLSADLERYQAGAPVSAQADSPWYRATKFVARHRRGLGVTLAVFLALGTALGAALWQAHERDLAARRAVAVSDYLVSLFQAADPNQAQGMETSALDLLDQGIVRIRTELEHSPAVKADLLLTLATIAERLGRYEQGLNLVADSIELREELYGARSAQSADALRRKGSLLALSGNWEAATAALRQALTIHRETGGKVSRSVARDLSVLGSIALDRQRPEYAETLYRKSLSLRERLPHADPARRAVVLGQLALAHRQQGEFAQAEALYKRALQLLRDDLGAHHPETVMAESNYAALLVAQGRYAQAEDLYHQVVTSNERLYPTDHPLTITARNNLAAAMAKQGKHQAAAAVFRELLAYWQTSAGADHPRTLITQVNLAAMLQHLGELDKAQRLYKTALDGFRQVFGKGHPYLAACQGHLAEIALMQDRLSDAASLAGQALEIRRAAHGAEHPSVAASLHQLGAIAQARGDLQQARKYYRSAYDLRAGLLGPQHPDTAASQAALTRITAH